MKRVIVICEGPTEQEFCLEVLSEELVKHDVYVEARSLNILMAALCLGRLSRGKS